MIKILHVVSSLSQGSGMMSMIMNYYRHIDTQKIQFDFLYFTDKKPSYEKEIKSLGGEVFTVGRPSISPKYLKDLNSFFEKNGSKYEALHAHPIFGSVFFANVARRNGVKNIIQHSHSSKFSNTLISGFRNYFLSFFFNKNVDYFIACSVPALKLFPKRKREEALILKNAIDLEKFSYNEQKRFKIRKKFNIEEDIFVIGHVGRFTEEKNQLYLIELYREIYSIDPKTILMLVGDGVLRKNVMQSVKKYKLENNVIFTGIQDHVEDFLSAMDIFVLPSKFEGFGMVAIEAQASSLITYCSQGVPSEVNVSKYHRKFDISDDKRIVANSILNERNYLRVEKKSNDLREYDIKNQAKQLEKFYLSLGGRKR